MMDFRDFCAPRAFVIASVVGAVLAPSRAARAEPTAADRETARALMQDGRDLRDQGDKSSALARFRAADDIMHVPSTAIRVAKAPRMPRIFSNTISAS